MNAMNELDTVETSAERPTETSLPTEAADAVDSADMTQLPPPSAPSPWAEEAEALRAVYPAFDLEAEMEHPVLGALLRGEAAPSLRQLYEAVHWEEVAERQRKEAVETAVEAAVAEAVPAAVAEAVKASEERLLGHIRARGQRPAENGTCTVAGSRLHAAVGRLTRRERAMLAKRAENGEHIRL